MSIKSLYDYIQQKKQARHYAKTVANRNVSKERNPDFMKIKQEDIKIEGIGTIYNIPVQDLREFMSKSTYKAIKEMDKSRKKGDMSSLKTIDDINTLYDAIPLHAGKDYPKCKKIELKLLLDMTRNVIRKQIKDGKIVIPEEDNLPTIYREGDEGQPEEILDREEMKRILANFTKNDKGPIYDIEADGFPQSYIDQCLSEDKEAELKRWKAMPHSSVVNNPPLNLRPENERDNWWKTSEDRD